MDDSDGMGLFSAAVQVPGRAGSQVGRTGPVPGRPPQDLSLLWGKWGDLDSPHPLVGHLLDTAAVALTLWSQLSPSVRRGATGLLAPGDEPLARGRFAVLAGVHDIGKATREFNGQAWAGGSAEFAAHRAALERAGLPTAVPARPKLDRSEAGWLRHEALTGIILGDLYHVPGWARRVVAGHHGRYQRPLHSVSWALTELRARAADPAWAAAQRSIIDTVVGAVTDLTGVDCALTGWPAEAPPELAPTVLVLTGLVCVCDWTASDNGFVRQAPIELLRQDRPDPPGYLRGRSTQALTTLTGVLAGSSTPTGDFPALFGGRTPRGAAQAWAASRRHGPGLSIVMAPMGEGKTELALYAHANDAGVRPGDPAGDGLFFGLPTVATADAMFTRVQAFWQGTRATGRLAHGQAVLHDFYQPSTLTPTGVCDGGLEHRDPGSTGASSTGAGSMGAGSTGAGGGGEGRADGLRPADWFSGRHRGLLAPVTVGTCDQVLAAALSHKFLPVRLAALAGKHIVLDEVHTYDPYQQELLCRLLSWLGAYRCRVTLLSATLPRARVQDLLTAWTVGWHRGAAPAVLDAARDRLPKTLPYPSVVTVAADAECTPLQAWRNFTLEVSTHQVPTDRSASVTQTAALLRQLRADQPPARIGLLVNTVDRAIALYQELRGDQDDSCLLHSRMTAGQRRRATATADDLLGPGAPARPMLLVATQVAEASLDFDLDVLVTDLAPMASLLQRTGRLWRHSVNTGSGWTHPQHLDYRTGDPVVHVLVPTGPDGRPEFSTTALPYTGAELRRTLTHPDCLNGGQRTALRIPQDVQRAVDGAHLSLSDLAEGSVPGRAGVDVGGDGGRNVGGADEAAETRDLLRHLADELAKTSASRLTGTAAHELAGWSADSDVDDNIWQGPDWSALTAPTLWDDRDGAVTRLQEREQATLLLYDLSGATQWAWHGRAETLLETGTSRPVLLDALAATIPVSGALARQLREAARAHEPAGWSDRSPALLRGLLPLPVGALPGTVRLDPDLGLVRQEHP